MVWLWALSSFFRTFEQVKNEYWRGFQGRY